MFNRNLKLGLEDNLWLCFVFCLVKLVYLFYSVKTSKYLNAF